MGPCQLAVTEDHCHGLKANIKCLNNQNLIELIIVKFCLRFEDVQGRIFHLVSTQIDCRIDTKHEETLKDSKD